MSLTKWEKAIIISAIFIALAMTAVSLFSVYAPSCEFPLSIEKLIRNSIIYSGLAVVNLFILLTFFFRSKVNFICAFTVALFFTLSVFTSTQRGVQLDKLYWEFDGVVSKKYRSDNHGARTIKVNGVDYEYIAPDLWDSIKVGDRVRKNSCEGISVISKE